MKKLLAFAVILYSVAACAQSVPTSKPKTTYRPFTYMTPCALETGITVDFDDCKVIETREKGGGLRTRNIFSNKFGLTIKGRFDKERGYLTWDSHNKFEYEWEYKVGGTGDAGAWTYVMPGFLVQNVSWD